MMIQTQPMSFEPTREDLSSLVVIDLHRSAIFSPKVISDLLDQDQVLLKDLVLDLLDQDLSSTLLRQEKGCSLDKSPKSETQEIHQGTNPILKFTFSILMTTRKML